MFKRMFLLRRTALPIALLSVILSGCDRADDPPDAAPVQRPAGHITLGDVDPDEPATRVRRIQPLANLLAGRLTDYGIGVGRVVVARDIGNMAGLLKEGKVDLYLDSPLPVLAANRESGSRSLLLRKAKGDAEYWAVFIARKDSGLQDIADLPGQVVVFQEPHSTSGFLLPAVHLMDAGLSLRGVARLDTDTPGNDVGCLFSGDEENTVEFIVSGRARVGVISNQDFRELPDALRDEMTVLGRTASVPRQLVAGRPGLDESLISAIERELLALTDADRERMAAEDAPRGWTWRFEPLSDTARATLAALQARIDSLPVCAVVR